MEPTIYKPSIYKGAGIYKTGAEGGGGNILPNPPENCEFIEYYIQDPNAAGYFIFTNADDLLVRQTDKIYTKFSIDLYNNGWSFRLYEIAGSNGGISFTLDEKAADNGGNCGVKVQNFQSSTQWLYPFPVTSGFNLYTITRTKEGFFGGPFSINKASANDQGYFSRFFINNQTELHVYKCLVTDENDLIIYSLIPIYNTLENKVGIFVPEKNKVFYPNSQSGFRKGPTVPYE